MLRRLAYVSAAQPQLPPDEIARIVARSRTNNSLNRISGVLLFAGDHFAQLIEGSPGHVSMLWNRILDDPRHRQPHLMFDLFDDGPRWFPDWRMGYLFDPSHAAELARWPSLPRPLPPDALARVRAMFAGADAM